MNTRARFGRAPGSLHQLELKNVRSAVPASRSRTDQWRECLRKVHERGGALEISVDRGQGAEGSAPSRGSDVVWRVKLISVSDTGMVVEPPSACGATISLAAGVKLVGAMTVGQNRWMFHTRVGGHVPGPHGSRALVLEAPQGVERCTRRGFYRISTADIRLPNVRCWALLDPTSIRAAEAANRAQINDLLNSGAAPTADESPDSILLPEVGPMFPAKLLNISGGGLGLLLSPEDSRALHSRPYLWLRVDLRPDVPAPIAVTCRLAHTHLDSAQNLYAGLAFDFGHNIEHRKFVVDLFSAYVGAVQSRQQDAQKKAA
jgi:hypothetical protein